MEGHGDMPLPDEKRPAKKGMNKMLVIAVVAIIVIAGLAGAFFLMGGEENKKPLLSATISDTAISAGESVTFNASASSDPEDGALTYSWDFGDGSTSTVGAVVSHTYNYPGIYMVQLVLEDEDGLKTNNLGLISNYRIDVQNPTPPDDPQNDTTPYAMMAASEYMFASGTNVSFIGNESKGYMISQELYDNGTIVMYDADGNPSFNATGVESNWELFFDYQYAFNSSGAQDPIEIITEYKWNFGDGSSVVTGNYEDAMTATHVYNGTGVIYTAYLEIKTLHNETQRYYYSMLVGYSATTTGAKNPDRFIMATIGEPDYVDPATDYETAGGEVLQNVYETLVFYDEDTLNLAPVLATSVPTIANGGISADGLTYNFTLRQGVKFHDGTQMTAEDVFYSFGRLLIINDSWGPAWMVGQVLIDDYYGHIATSDITWNDIREAIWVKSDYSIQFNLTYAYPAFMYVLAFNACSIVSEDFVEAHGGVVANTHNDYMDRHTCGTGPYMLTEWVPNSHILMTRNDNYWQEPAQLKYVIIKKVQDVGTRILMLKSGDADSIYLPRDHKSDVSSLSTVRIVEGKATFNMDFLGLNENITNAADIGNIPATFFADKNIRMAFASAFDYDLYITSVFLDAAEQPNGVIPSGMFGYNASIGKYEFNLTAAAAYLENASNPSQPGKSYADTGFTLTLFYNAGNLPRETACQLLKAGLEKLSTDGLIDGDIHIDVQALDWPVYLEKVRSKELPAFFLGWAPDYADPDNYMNPFLHSSGTYALRCSINNATITAWIEEAAQELNETVRAGIYSNISEAVYDECYYIWTAQATSFHVERTWVTGYYFNPMYSGFYYYQFGKTA
jgi:peptide/nickel transport system substrate-binding protein